MNTTKKSTIGIGLLLVCLSLNAFSVDADNRRAINNHCWNDGYLDGKWKLYRCNPKRPSQRCLNLEDRRWELDKQYPWWLTSYRRVKNIKQACEWHKTRGGDHATAAYDAYSKGRIRGSQKN